MRERETSVNSNSNPSLFKCNEATTTTTTVALKVITIEFERIDGDPGAVAAVATATDNMTQKFLQFLDAWHSDKN